MSRQENQKKLMGKPEDGDDFGVGRREKNQSTQKGSRSAKGTGHRQEHRKSQDTARMLGANGSVLDAGVGCHFQGGC